MPNPREIYYLASTVSTTSSDSGQTPPTRGSQPFGDPLAVGECEWITIDINVSAIGASPSYVFKYQRLGGDGIYYDVWTSSAITATGNTSISIGPGMETNKSPGNSGRLLWTAGGSGGLTFSATVGGK